jgi:hypothetical protein
MNVRSRGKIRKDTLLIAAKMERFFSFPQTGGKETASKGSSTQKGPVGAMRQPV